MKTNLRQHLRPFRFLNGIDVTVFLIVHVLLLIIFMVLPPPSHHGSYIDLARTRHAAPMRSALRENSMLVTVTRNGNIYFGFSQTQPAQLPARIEEARHGGSERKLYLKVDARARYTDAAAVIDAAREAGIQNIAIITNQP